MTFTPPTIPGTRYRVYITPLTAMNVYGDEIDVTDHVTMGGVNQIKRAIDSTDYEIGVYFYSDLELIGSNDNGYFNDNTDLRSIFPYLRDRAKVRVVFERPNGSNVVYHGLINEEATRVDALNETITFRVLSRDSVIRNTNVSAGVITNGLSAKDAIFLILNNPVISSVLTISAGNINPNLNFTIDVGSAFDSTPSQESLNSLLLASNSIMVIDSTGTIFVRDRGESTDKPVLNLYGPYDIHRRQNVIDITNYNLGIQRMFTSVKVTDGNAVDAVFDNVALISTFGYRQTAFEFKFITNAFTIESIGKRLLAEFSAPKIELEIEVPTSIAQTADLTDRVSIDWPLRIVPIEGKRMPVIGTAKIGDANLPLPKKFGSLTIPPEMAFKVMEINEDPGTFNSILKLRQVGTSMSDGWFTNPASSIIGFAVIGIAKIGGTGSTDSKWNPSVIGAARVGSTKIA